MMRKAFFVPGVLLAAWIVGGASGCQPSSDEVQHDQQEHILLQGTNAVGMPAITNFAERKMLKTILELRDNAIVTTTYIVDLYGHLHKFCDSVGYGLPYATQFTSPQKIYEGVGHDSAVVPQADPNGLFSPASADGTWIACTDPSSKTTQVVYVEPHIVVSPFTLDVR